MTSPSPSHGPLAPLLQLHQLILKAPPFDTIPLIDRLHRETATLLDTIYQYRNEASAQAVLDFLSRVPYEADSLVQQLNEDQRWAMQHVYETAQRVLDELIFVPRTLSEAWQTFTLPLPKSCTLLHHLAARLRQSGSEKLWEPADSLDPAALAGQDLETQAKRLGSFLSRADAVVPFDLLHVQKIVHPPLMPLVFYWGMNSYMTSPNQALLPGVQENLRRFQDDFSQLLNDPPPGLLVPSHPSFLNAVFRAPYIREGIRGYVERVSREMIAPFSRHYVPQAASHSFERTPAKPYRVGIVTRYWYPRHPVHRCLSPMVHDLADSDFHLSWFFIRVSDEEFDYSFTHPPHALFEFRTLPILSPPFMQELYDTIQRQELDLLFFPEIGLNIHTAMLARLRAARVQAAGYGHPLSSGSDCIDYFLGGTAIEDSVSAAEYTERLVLIPGLGVHSTVPPIPAPRSRPIDGRPIRLINVSTVQKYNADLMAVWMTILSQARVPVELHLYPNLPTHAAERMAAQIRTIMHHYPVFVHSKRTRADLMRDLADSDVYLESFPFGGYNTLVEALSTGIPAVTLRGKTAPTRFGPAIINELNLPLWLIAADREGYTQAALRLIHNDQERVELRGFLNRERVIEALCHGREPEYFAKAIDWMILQGPRKPSDNNLPFTISTAHDE